MTCLGAKHLKFEGCSNTFYQNGRKNGYRICLSKTCQQIRKLSNLGAKVCLTAVKLQMFGYQACHVCTQLEHVFLSHVHA